MLRFTAHTLRAAAIVVPALLATSIAGPSRAQSYDDFHTRLAPYGTWSNNARWGEVWHPTRVDAGFRPYYNGHWEDTNEYGWLWVSDESWGDVPYHYGRWVSDPSEGWLWVPGYVWGPSWVVWRSGGGNIGWFPMPPGDNYDGQGAYAGNYDNEYGYRDWYGPGFDNTKFLSLWVFVGETHFRDRNFRAYTVPQRDYGRFISQTRDTTNYTTVNNYVVNRSVDAARLQQDTKQRFQPVAASKVMDRNALVTQVSAGRQVEQRERQQHPIPVNINPAEQRGRAAVNSSVQQQNAKRTPQDTANGPGRAPNSNGLAQPSPQAGRAAAGAPVAPAAEASRQNNRGQANLNPAEHAAPVAHAPPPKAKEAAPVLSERREPAPAAQPPQRGAQEQNGKVVAQESRAPARVQRSPGADAPARENKQGETKSPEERKPAEEKKSGGGRGQN